MNGSSVEEESGPHAHRILQLWESLTPEHLIEEPEEDAQRKCTSSGDATGLSRRTQTRHINSFGYQMKRSLEILADELTQEGKIFRFSLIGGDHGNQNGYWKLYCNGLWVASINQGYAYRSFKDSPTGFIGRVRELIKRKEIQPLSENTIKEIRRIENQFEFFRNSLAEESSDSDAFASAWAVFISSLKEEGV